MVVTSQGGLPTQLVHKDFSGTMLFLICLKPVGSKLLDFPILFLFHQRGACTNMYFGKVFWNLLCQLGSALRVERHLNLIWKRSNKSHNLKATNCKQTPLKLPQDTLLIHLMIVIVTIYLNHLCKWSWHIPFIQMLAYDIIQGIYGFFLFIISLSVIIKFYWVKIN